MRLIALSVAWGVGIVLGAWLQPPWAVVGLAIAVVASLLVVWARRPQGRWAAGLALVALLAMGRWVLAQPRPGRGALRAYAGQEVILRGAVVGEGVVQGADQSFPFAVEALRLPGQAWKAVRGTALVRADPLIAVAYGERLSLVGELERPSSGGRFSYRAHLARQGIHVQLRAEGAVERLPGRGGTLPARLLFLLRRWCRERIESFLPEPSASLLVGILLGTRTTMPAAVQEAFSRTGTTHILAISGWNISIVAAFLTATSRRALGRRWSLPLVLAGIALYTLLVGAGAAVLRAALMGMLYVVAQHLGRPGDGVVALLAAAWAMTLWNPGLLWDIGFQLSFCATLGMLLLVPPWNELLRRWPGFIAESLAATVSSQVLTWPLMAYYFRHFSLIVPLANLLACPTLAPLMLLGCLLLALGTAPGLGFLLQGATWLLSTYLLRVVGWGARFPWAAVGLPVVGPAFLVVYYGAVGWWIYRYWALQRGPLHRWGAGDGGE